MSEPVIDIFKETFEHKSSSTMLNLKGHGREWLAGFRVTQLVDPIWIKRVAAYSTQTPDVLPKAPLLDWYRSEHSPIRMGLYVVELRCIPNYVCGHLVRHHVGSMPFMQTSRPDRGGADDASRYDMKNLALCINSQGFIDIARKRLCAKTDSVTRTVIETVKVLVGALDADLAKCMMSNCEYRGGQCFEFKSCGRCSKEKKS
jgi:hypothetical protein